MYWEALGAMFMVLTGSALHFAFSWSNDWQPIALIAAVNESIWEHLKLAFWPGLIWALFPNKFSTASVSQRTAMRGFSLFVTVVSIVIVFETYTSMTGRNLLVLDIGTFVFAIVLGQLLVVFLLGNTRPSPRMKLMGLLMLSAQVVAFSLFTYFPPDHWLFVDQRTGLSGL